MRSARTAYKVDIQEQLAYGPALLKQAFQRRLLQFVEGKPCTADNVIISMTSFPQRLPKLHHCIRSLLSQSVRAEKIILYLAREECIDDHIPARLRRLQREGLEIRFVDTNVRSLNKIYHALEDFPDKAIVTCDDDKLYPLNWMERLVATAQAHPECIACNRSRLIVFNAHGKAVPYIQWPLSRLGGPTNETLPMGVSGVFYPPGSLHPDVLDANLYLKLSATSDDLWLKIMALRQGTQCVQVVPMRAAFPSIPFWQGQKLSPGNIWQDGNNKNLEGILTHFQLDLAQLIRGDGE